MYEGKTGGKLRGDGALCVMAADLLSNLRDVLSCELLLCECKFRESEPGKDMRRKLEEHVFCLPTRINKMIENALGAVSCICGLLEGESFIDSGSALSKIANDIRRKELAEKGMSSEEIELWFEEEKARAIESDKRSARREEERKARREGDGGRRYFEVPDEEEEDFDNEPTN